jgi:transcriptional regulator with XRE-family HTH domain
MVDMRSTLVRMTEMTTSPAIPEWTLGWRLQRALDFAGIKVETLAGELEVSRGTVGNWMHDRNQPQPVFLKLIALRCGVPYEWLRNGETRPFAGVEAATASSGPVRATRGRSGSRTVTHEYHSASPAVAGGVQPSREQRKPGLGRYGTHARRAS